MTIVAATHAKSHLPELIERVGQAHAPITITGKRANAVLISEDDWNAIQETLYLISIPGLRESLIEGMRTPIEECEEGLDW